MTSVCLGHEYADVDVYDDDVMCNEETIQIMSPVGSVPGRLHCN